MATIGVASASYYANASIQQFDRASVNSVERISKAKNEIANGDAATLAAMDYTFKLDLAGTQAALKNIAVTQAYLSTAITSIDSASAILAKIQELAVMGANSTNSDVQMAGINAEAEALADEFHKAIINANYKGKQIFTDDQIGANLSIGGGGQIGNYTIAVLDYDDFYDVKNPNTESLLDGVEYEVTRDLSDIEKEAIVARTDGVSVEDLTTGFRFKTNNVSLENVGIGVVKMRDDTNIGNTQNDNLASYTRNQAQPVRIDSGAYVSVEGEFNGGSIEFAINENWETSDVLSLADTDKISFRDDGEIIYHTIINGQNLDVEIGKLNTDLDGLNGKPLKIDLYSDATVPGTSGLQNGDFEDGKITVGFEPYPTYTPGIRRENSINGYDLAGGTGYTQKIDTTSTGLARGSDTYSVVLENISGSGTGSGFRANLSVNANGSISIVEVLDKGEGYQVGDVLGLAAGTLGEGASGSNFRLTVSSVIVADPVGQGTTGVEVVSDPQFATVNYYEQQTQSGVYDGADGWGERYQSGALKKVVSDQNGTLTNYRHTDAGSYDFDFGVALSSTSLKDYNTANAGRYNAATQSLDYIDQDIVLEKISTDGYVAQPGDVVVYQIDPLNGNRVQDAVVGAPEANDNEVFTTETLTVEQWNNSGNQGDYTAVYEAINGVTQYTNISLDDRNNDPRADDVPVYGDPQIIAKDAAVIPNNAIPVYEVDGNNQRVREVISTVGYVAQPGDTAVPGAPVRTDQVTNTPVYVQNVQAGTYSWGESYNQNSDKLVADDNGSITQNYKHLSGGTYQWAATGQFTWQKNGIAFNANYNVGDLVYEMSDTGGDGWDAIMRVAEVPEVAFYVKAKTLQTSKVVDYYLEDSISHYLRDKIDHYEVPTIESYNRPNIVGYERTYVSGYTRDRVLGYLREKTLYTDTVLLGTSEKYIGEVNRAGNAHTGWDQNEGSLIPNWTKYNAQIKFGENFTIFDFDENRLNDTIIPDPYDGNYAFAGEFINIPTPTMDDMSVDPAYEYNGNVATDAVKAAGDNFAPVSGPTNAFVDLVNNTTDGVAGDGLKLATGSLTFGPGDNFGVYHGPAIVSDVFSATAGQFLKMDYAALGIDDDYHVTGYIYNVDEVNPKLHLAIGDTGTSANSRMSVEVPENGNYRFVFIVGTYDKTGGRLAGADMTIDNIVAEDPYAIEEDAIAEILRAVQYAKTDGTTSSNPTKTLMTKITNGKSDENEVTLYEQTNINIVGYELTNEEDGPYAIIPTLNLVTKPSDATKVSSDALISKIENVHGQLRSARIQAVASYGALDAALSSVTDLRSQYAMGSSTISDLNFTQEAANLTKRQIQMDIATSILAQANKAQEGIMSLLEK
ncbi:MAG: hypothetical protein EBT51_06610 [Flavobacteriaceae bacterium]|nr:hypothetical protein [Flavobacteriaceae bacterium]